MRFSGRELVIVFGLAFLISGFQNCSGVDFNGIDSARKASAIDTGVVMDPPGGGRDPDHYDDEPGKDPITGITIGTDRICSEMKFMKNGGVGFLNSSTLTLNITDTQSDQVICSNSNAQALKDQVKTQSRISLPTCTLVDGRSYKLTLIGDQGKSVLYNSVVEKIELRQGKPITIDLLIDNNLDQSDKEMTDEELAAAQPFCDKRQSPLVLDTRRNVKEKGVKLSSPEEGILFDIAGLNASPVAHTKYRISWPKSKRYEFLVLPNAHGKVEGINEMFGDNTLGPDQKFAANGFLALAKHDENADGVISAQDSIFRHLRLWADLNRDGESQAKELRSLSAADIEAIDLVYDSNYEEMDRYGNMTKFKSVVKFKDGDYRLVFDVWFKNFGLH